MMALADILAPALAHAAELAAFQESLNTMSPARQKRTIIEALGNGLLSREDTALLFQVYDLANA